MEYNFFAAGTIDYLNLAQQLIFSLKYFKKQDVKYNFYLMIDTQDVNQYFNLFIPYASSDFCLYLISTNGWKESIVPQTRISPISIMSVSYTAYLRCLISQILPHIDKILYLDLDTLICKNGIEKIFEEDITNYYAAGTIDLQIQNFNTINELNNVQTDKYFNSGVLLFNLKKIRQDGYNKILKNACLNWPKEIQPLFWDQTLLNYYFKNNIKEVSHIYNSYLAGTNIKEEEILLESCKKYNINSLEEYLNQLVVIHFAGFKPWKNQILKGILFEGAVKKYLEILQANKQFLLPKNK